MKMKKAELLLRTVVMIKHKYIVMTFIREVCLTSLFSGDFEYTAPHSK